MIPVLIVGAGPTGLVLALWLTRIGIKVRIIDKAERAGTTSRALVVHARTLEFYRQLGIDKVITEAGIRFPALNLWVQSQKRSQLKISSLGQGLTPFPYILVLSQDQHEEILIAELKEFGVEIERKTELIALEEKSDHVQAEILLPNGELQSVSAQFVTGCDGARSRVRQLIGAEFEGSTYPNWFYVADVEGKGPVFNGELHVSLNEAEFIVIFPLKKQGTARFIGVIRTEEDGSKLTWKDVSQRIITEMKAKVDRVNWFSTYHVHHRVALKFQKGRTFILGDAGHIHSPVGGQGMNTGIGDAVNLAWKLGEVLKGKASLDLLETYEVERMAFAKRLVNTTDQVFKFVSSDGPIARQIRTRIAPVVIPRVFKYFSGFFFRMISQTAIHYRHCSWNKGEAGILKGGDRLPWIESVDNYGPLKNLSWQVHIYGGNSFDGPTVFHFPWNQEMENKGLTKGTAYVIRPDGYIGFISSKADPKEITDYLRRQ